MALTPNAQECDKDAPKLKRRVQEECISGKIDHRFLRVLDDNIKVADLANYVNKGKLFRFMKDIAESVSFE